MSVDELIPQNEEGFQTDTESSADCGSDTEAREFFQTVAQRLMNINGWHEYAGRATADFSLTDENGNIVQREPRMGDHFKIKIPAPGTDTGDGYDWVRVEAVESGEDEVLIRVRPASNPTNDRNDVAHFFSDAATSCFSVRRENTKVTAGVHGRNEKPNLDADKIGDKLRNAAVAAGAITGFSKLQWKSLVNGLVTREGETANGRR